MSLQFVVLKDIDAAVADAGDDQAFVGFHGGDERGAHAFQAGVGGGGIHHAAIGFFKGADQGIGHGIAVAVRGIELLEQIVNGLDRQLGGVLAGLRTAHAVGNYILAERGGDQKVIFIICANAPHVGRAVGFDHELSDYTRFPRRRS